MLAIDALFSFLATNSALSESLTFDQLSKLIRLTSSLKPSENPGVPGQAGSSETSPAKFPDTAHLCSTWLDIPD